MEKTIIKRFLITTAIMVLVVIPFLSAAITAKVTEGQTKEFVGVTQEEIDSIANYWYDHEDELIECFKPITDFISHPEKAPEILKDELGLDVTKLSLEYVNSKNSH